MQPAVEIIGVYPLDEVDPCHMIELVITDFVGKLHVEAFTQELPGRAPDEWEIPWDEHVLNAPGTQEHEIDWSPPHLDCLGALRLVLFFHNLDVSRPLLTPFGPVQLPLPTMKPARLNFIAYESPW